MPSKTPALVGAGLALLAFLFVGLMPAITFGNYAGLLLAKGIFGSPLEGAPLENALIGFGALMGAVGVSGLFAVTGAASGAAVGGIVHLVAAPFRSPQAEEFAPQAEPAPAQLEPELPADEAAAPGEPEAIDDAQKAA